MNPLIKVQFNMKRQQSQMKSSTAIKNSSFNLSLYNQRYSSLTRIQNSPEKEVFTHKSFFCVNKQIRQNMEQKNKLILAFKSIYNNQLTKHNNGLNIQSYSQDNSDFTSHTSVDNITFNELHIPAISKQNSFSLVKDQAKKAKQQA